MIAAWQPAAAVRPLVLAAALLLGAAGCRPAAEGTGAAAPADAVVQGTVVVTGTADDAVASVLPEGGVGLVVQGPLARELRSLAGAMVSVRGVPGGEGLRRTVAVHSYEILSIAGRRPFTGVILADGRLAAGADTLRLVGASPGPRPGIRVWVTGERADGSLRVASWGAIGS